MTDYSDFPILTSAFGIVVRHDVKRHGRGTLCMRCGKVNRRPWKHPILVALKKRRRWSGTVYGGCIVCESCEPLMAVEIKQAHGEPSLLDESGIPPEFRMATWDDFSDRRGALTSEIRDMRKWYDSKESSWLYLTGKVGTGKTMAACTLARQWLIERGLASRKPTQADGRPARSVRVRFIRAHDFFSQLREAEFSRNGGMSIESLLWYEVLVFDDLGAEKPTDYTRSRLLSLLEARHDRKARTIITSNYTLNELTERLEDDRVPSRLAQWCQGVTLQTTDYRLQEAKRKRAKR